MKRVLSVFYRKLTDIRLPLFKICFSFLLSALFLAATTQTEATDRPNIDGIYNIHDKLPAQEVTDLVEILEFMSFYCGHCYRFSKKELVLKGRHPHRIRFKYVPIQWGKGSTKPAEAFLIAESMGKGDEMKTLLFKAGFEEHKDISQDSVLEELARSLGLGAEFGKQLRSGDKKGQVQGNIKMARDLSVNETPSFIIAGNIVVSSSISGGNMEVLTLNMDTIIDSLLKEGKK